MKKEVYFQWLIKSVPNASVVALAQAAALQVASKKTAVFMLSTLLNVSTAVLAQATAPQVQSNPNNSVLKKVSLRTYLFSLSRNIKQRLIPSGISLLFYLYSFSFCLLITTTEDSTRTIPVSFSMDTLSWKTTIPRIAATTGSMVAVTDALDAGSPLSPFV